jgi:hypothetical protein
MARHRTYAVTDLVVGEHLRDQIADAAWLAALA